MTIANILLILIIGSGCCVLMGVVITTVRLVRIIRRERALADKIQSYWQTKEADFPATAEDAETASKSSGIE